MKKHAYCIALALLAILIIAGSCGKGKSLTDAQPQVETQEQTQQNSPAPIC